MRKNFTEPNSRKSLFFSARGCGAITRKALISARGRQYKTTHNLNELVGDVRRADPEFRFRLTIDGQIYNQYAGRDEYRPTKTPLTGISDYEEATKADIQQLLERVREIRESLNGPAGG